MANTAPPSSQPTTTQGNDILVGFNTAHQIFGDMIPSNYMFVDGLAVNIRSPENRNFTVQQNQIPLDGSFVTGSTGQDFRALLPYSYMIQFDVPSDNLIASIALPFNVQVLQQIGIDSANTFVGKLSADGKSWEIDESRRTVDNINRKTGSFKLTSIEGEFILLGRQETNDENIFVDFGEGQGFTANFTGGPGKHQAEFADGLKFTIETDDFLQLNVDLETPIDPSSIPQGLQSLNSFAWIVNTTAQQPEGGLPPASPATESPATEPPATEPPATEPPATESPAPSSGVVVTIATIPVLTGTVGQVTEQVLYVTETISIGPVAPTEPASASDLPTAPITESVVPASASDLPPAPVTESVVPASASDLPPAPVTESVLPVSTAAGSSLRDAEIEFPINSAMLWQMVSTMKGGSTAQKSRSHPKDTGVRADAAPLDMNGVSLAVGRRDLGAANQQFQVFNAAVDTNPSSYDDPTTPQVRMTADSVVLSGLKQVDGEYIILVSAGEAGTANVTGDASQQVLKQTGAGALGRAVPKGAFGLVAACLFAVVAL